MKKFMISSFLGLTLMAVGCSSGSRISQDAQPNTKENNNSNNTSQGSTTGTATLEKGKVFTLSDLKKFDGKNGNAAYVAVDGIVYDVTHARQWKNGIHQGGATAGNDLSHIINSSPHGKEILSEVPVVGTLKQ